MICGVCGNDHGIHAEPLTCHRVRQLAKALLPIASHPLFASSVGKELAEICDKIVKGETNAENGL